MTAADPTNPGLDPQSVLPRLGEISHKTQPSFLLIWRECKTGTARRHSELIALVPLAPATITQINAPWLTGWADSWWPVASPIVHRRHYSAVADAIINWLSDKLVPTGALVLRDLVSDAPFTQALLANPRATVFRRGRAQPTLSLCPLVAPAELAGRTDIVVKGDPTLTTADLDACLSLSALWRDGIGPNGIISPDVLSGTHYDYLTTAANQGRLMLAKALLHDSTAAMALALRTGAMASIISLAASPRLGAQDQDIVLNRALTGLIASLGGQGLASAIEAPPDSPELLTIRLSEHRNLIDVIMPGTGLAGRTLMAANWLRQRMC
ncbi:MAG: hypothetical protein HKN60_00460 [Rhizobiales bacterium]|nr:hypothetical protein [Hyphomicrobiales bacterium]